MLRYEFEEIPFLHRGRPIADLMGVAEIDVGDTPSDDPHVDSITIWYPLRGGKTSEVKLTYAAEPKLWKHIEDAILSRAQSKIYDARNDKFAEHKSESYDRLLPQELR